MTCTLVGTIRAQSLGAEVHSLGKRPRCTEVGETASGANGEADHLSGLGLDVAFSGGRKLKSQVQVWGAR